MPIVNVPIDVPVDLAVRIAAGELYRDGSVVRHVISKRIVKHLSEVDRDATAKAANKPGSTDEVGFWRGAGTRECPSELERYDLLKVRIANSRRASRRCNYRTLCP